MYEKQFVVISSSVKRKGEAPTFSALLSGPQDAASFRRAVYRKNAVCIVRETTDPLKCLTKETICKRLNALKHIDRKSLAWARSHVVFTTDYEYKVFRIAKRSGGFRSIWAPRDDVKVFQRKMVKYVTEAIGGCHSAAFAYCKGKSVRNVLVRHEKAGSNWFLKLDIHHFFDSTSLGDAASQIQRIWPFSTWDICDIQSKLACMFPKGLMRQGPASSPGLSNLIMIPFDFRMSAWAKANGFVYTRYADDMLISHKNKFDWKEATSVVQSILKDEGYHYRLNADKTRFGSINGRNWNLGMMLNKDRQITTGWESKKNLRSALSHLCSEIKSGTVDSARVSSLAGEIAWMNQVQKGSGTAIAMKIGEKFNVNLIEVLNISN